MTTLADKIRAAVHHRAGNIEATTHDILLIIQPRLDALARERTAYALGPHVRRGNVTAQPGQRLTPREIAVLRLVATGHTNARIAAQLGITEGGVVQRMKAIFVKLVVHDRAHALARAIATGQIIIDTEPGQPPADTGRWCLREELEQTEAMYLAAGRRAVRYRAAWQSARRRARLIPEAGQEIHDGTRWCPALQAYSMLRARLTRAEQQLATLHEGEQPYEDERIVPTPGQWIWQWNRATPERRQEIAALVLEQQDRLNHYTWTERPELHERAEAAERRLAALHGQTPQPAEPRTHNSDIWEDEDGWHVSCEHYDCPDSSRDVGSEYDAEEWAEQHRAEATAEDAATRTRDGGSL